MKVIGARLVKAPYLYYLIPSALLIAAFSAILVRYRAPEISRKNAPHSMSFSHPEDWMVLGGSWSPQDLEVTNSSEERGAKLISRTDTRSDYQVESDIQMIDPRGDVGLILRSSGEEEGVDAYHGYLASIRPSQGIIEFGRADFGWQALAREYFRFPVNAHSWIHLRVVAVGCNFAFSVTFAEGHSVSMTAADSSCIVSGHTGLRSSLTAAKWRSLKIQPASLEDIKQIQIAANPDREEHGVDHPDFNLTPAELDRYMASLRSEAKEHVVSADVRPIHSFMMTPGKYQNVTIRGAVISTPPLVELQDDSGSIAVSDYQSQSLLKLGDVVEARGSIISEGFWSYLKQAHLRVLWSDVPIPPLAVTASQLTSGAYRGRAITVEGTLVSVSLRPGGYELILSDKNHLFKALGFEDLRTNPRALEPGSRLWMRGTATGIAKYTDNIYPFAIITNQVDVLNGPPWWSVWHIFWLSVGVIAVFLSIQVAFSHLQQWRMNSVMREREHLALEMHDTLAQSFTGIAYQLQAAHAERRGESHVQAQIESALEMVRLSHKEASRTIASLRPQYRDAAAIVESLKESAEKLIDGDGLQIQASLVGPNVTLPPAITDALFRIGQEAVSNAIQHSECRILTIQLDIGQNRVRLTIADGGKGFDAAAVHEGLGLKSMKSRAVTAKIDFDIRSTPKEGTTVSACSRRFVAHGLFQTARRMVGRLKKTMDHGNGTIVDRTG